MLKDVSKALTPEKLAMLGVAAIVADSIRFHILSPFANRFIMHREVDDTSTDIHLDQFARTLLIVLIGTVIAWLFKRGLR